MAKTTVDFTGTVSEATMRPEDLIPAFLDVLDGYWPEKAAELREEYEYNDPAFDYDSEDADWLCDALFDALDEIAPEGHYFGAHPGDGSDYGFWECEDDSAAFEAYVDNNCTKTEDTNA